MLRLMRVATALVLAALLMLTGCAQDEPGDVATDETTSGSPTGTPDDDATEDGKEPTGDVDFELVEMLTETGAGGESAEEATALPDEAAVEEFAAQFSSEEMGAQLMSVFNSVEVPEGQALYGAVVAVGCDVPPGVLVTSTDDGVAITGQKVESPMKECFAPMTTVAVVLVDEADVG